MNNMETTYEGKQFKQCRSCKASIVFLKTKHNKFLPVDAETVDDTDEIYTHGKHRAHFATCPDAKQFRRK